MAEHIEREQAIKCAEKSYKICHVYAFCTLHKKRCLTIKKCGNIWDNPELLE